MPTGDSIFTDTKRQFIFVILSFIVSIIYLKKTWYEYWGLWMMLLSFVMFSVFTAGAKTQLMESLIATFGLQGYDFIIGFLVLVPFVLILASIIILVDVSTTIVRKKHEGKITGKHETDNAYRKMAYSLTGEISYKDETYSMQDFFEEYKDGAKIYPNFVKSFDIIISAVSFLILFVYTSQFAALLTQTVDTPGVKTALANSLNTATGVGNKGLDIIYIIRNYFYPPNAAPAGRLTKFEILLFVLGMLLFGITVIIGGGIVVAVAFITTLIALLLSKISKISKETFNFQFSKQGWPLITYLCSLILGSIGVAYSGEALKLKSQMRDDFFE
jgi:hypothetical protein